MPRLTSLASVLESLNRPEDGRTARPARPEARSGSPRTGHADAVEPESLRFARIEPPGYEIWESARRQAEFYATYAEMIEEGSAADPGDDAIGWAATVYPPGNWAGPATLATAYRVAAQHAALVDPRWATRLAVRAGMAYVAAGLPFGLFLLTGLLDDRTLRDSATFGDVVAPFEAPDASAAARHPVQQTYLLLAAASRPWLREPLKQTLDGAARRLALYGARPIGPQAVPLADYLELADVMEDNLYWQGSATARNAQIGYLARQLASMHRGQAAALRAARRNQYLWRRGAAPVNVVDLEHVAISGLALRHRPWFDELSEAITDELRSDDPLAELPVWTMGEIEAELPSIAPTVIDILRDPDRARRTDDFRDPDTTASPWDVEREASTQARRTRADRPEPDHPRPERTRQDRPGDEVALYDGDAYPQERPTDERPDGAGPDDGPETGWRRPELPVRRQPPRQMVHFAVRHPA
jgi:hypothetical protein